MHFYRLVNTGCDPDMVLGHYETQAQAHSSAKDFHRNQWLDLRIELIDVPTDKASICNILNGEGGLNGVPVLRTFKLTPRGGLAECANGE